MHAPHRRRDRHSQHPTHLSEALLGIDQVDHRLVVDWRLVDGDPVRSGTVAAEVTGGDWASFRLTDDFGAAGAIGSLAFVAYTVGMAGMRFGGDWLQARLGRMTLHRLSVTLAAAGLAVASLVPNEAVAVAGFLLVGVGVATFMPKLYDDAARLPGRRGAGLGAMTAGMRLAFLATPVAVGTLAGTRLTVGAAIAIVTLPAIAALVVVTEYNERLLRRWASAGAGSADQSESSRSR